MNSLLQRRVGLFVGGTLVLSAFAAGHGIFQKPSFNVGETIVQQWVNSKQNAATRGSSGANGNQLYVMEPVLNHTGALDTIGFKARMQDVEGATQETTEFAFVKYAADGVSPDESPTGKLHSISFPLFGFGAQGLTTFDFLISVGQPISLPANHGIGIKLPPNASWPADGATVLGQLNLPGDPLQPRLYPPFDQQVWVFERPEGTASAVPLGGRTADTLLVATVWIQQVPPAPVRGAPVLKAYTLSTAYGGAPEELYGPESMHPLASRGDSIGFLMQGGNDGTNGIVLFLLSPRLSTDPVPFPIAHGSNLIHLDLTAPWPIILDIGSPDPVHGLLKTTPIPLRAFPGPLRAEFYVQALLIYPDTGNVWVTDTVGVKAL
jgi:hypothetical protein